MGGFLCNHPIQPLTTGGFQASEGVTAELQVLFEGLSSWQESLSRTQSRVKISEGLTVTSTSTNPGASASGPQFPGL